MNVSRFLVKIRNPILSEGRWLCDNLKPAPTILDRLANDPSSAIQQRTFSVNSQCLSRWNRHNEGPQRWLKYNKIVHPPQKPDEEPRKAVSIYTTQNYERISKVHLKRSSRRRKAHLT